MGYFFWENEMKLLVSGCAGFIGSRFCEMAIMAGHDVIGVDALMYSGRKANLAHAFEMEGTEGRGVFEFVRADICDSADIALLFSVYKPDAVVHLAAETHVARSIGSRDEFLRTNVLGTNVLLEESLKYWRGERKPEDIADKPVRDGFLFLHVSTDEVYGSLGPDEAPWTEGSPYLPNNPYSASKAASDHLVRSYYHTYGLPTIITHAANNYGPRQHPEKLIPTLIRQCMNGQPMTLHGDGQQKRDWLHVDDHCAGLLAVLEHGKVGEVYNFGGECERTNEQIAHLAWKSIFPHIKDQYGQGLPNWMPVEIFGLLKYIEDRAGNDRRYYMDIGKANRDLGWKPQRTIEEALPQVVRWYLEHPDYEAEYGK